MEIKTELSKAINLHQQGNLNEAKKIYEDILKINPNLAEIHLNLVLFINR